MTLTAAQVWQACTLLKWKSSKLCQRAGLSYATALKAKTDDGLTTLPDVDVWAIRVALERAGVRFALDAEGRPGAELRPKAP